MLADVAHSRGTEQGVSDRMADDVGIRVPDQPARVLDPEPAQVERQAVTQPVRIVPDSNPQSMAPSVCPFNEDRSVFALARLSRRPNSCPRSFVQQPPEIPRIARRARTCEISSLVIWCFGFGFGTRITIMVVPSGTNWRGIGYIPAKMGKKSFKTATILTSVPKWH